MGRLLIRHETSLQVLKQNSAWHVYLQPGQQGPLPLLFRASEAYRSEAKNKHMEIPLRAQLLHTLFQTVLQCVGDHHLGRRTKPSKKLSRTRGG